MNDYDEVFAEFLKFEYEHIPGFFRFNKGKFIAIACVMTGLVILGIVIMIILPNTIEYISLESGNGTYQSFPITTYNRKYLITLIFTGIIIALLAVWILIGIGYEKRAFRRASLSASDVVTYNRMVEKNKCQYRKFHSGTR